MSNSMKVIFGWSCVVMVLAGCSTTSVDDGVSSSPPSPNATATATATDRFTTRDPLRLAVVGDSNTNGFTGTLTNGIDQAMAYVCYAVDDTIEYAGGWANDGATSTFMSQNVQPIDDVDVLAIMIGTNNPAAGIAYEQLDVDIESVVALVKPTDVVILAIPPINAIPNAPVEMNVHLEELAGQHGWYFNDAWDDVRGRDQKWNPAYMRDGLHTTKAGYKELGGNVKEYLKETFFTAE